MKRFLLFALAGLMCATTATGSRAEPLAPPGINDNQWRFSLTPYIFLPADVSGDSTVAGQTVSIDFDTSELLDILNFAFATRAEAWKGNFAIILDGNYVDVGLDATTKGPGPFPGGEEVDVDVRQFYLDFLASYRVLKKPYNDDGDLWTLEVMGGGRYNYLKQVIDLKEEGSLGPGVTTTLGGSETWVDPMVGARVMAMLSDRWSMSVRGDIGGFGITDTDLTWSLTGGVDYRPWEQTSLKFGWRYYSIDYATTLNGGAFAYDIEEYGPFVGVTFTFQ